jgi:hypothetical protein
MWMIASATSERILSTRPAGKFDTFTTRRLADPAPADLRRVLRQS